MKYIYLILSYLGIFTIGAYCATVVDGHLIKLYQWLITITLVIFFFALYQEKDLNKNN